MNLTVLHGAVVLAVILATTVLGLGHVLAGPDIQTIFVACIGSLAGHAVGYAAASRAQGH